jgi:hypothetical protein
MTTENYIDVTKDGAGDDTPTVTNIIIVKRPTVDGDEPISEEAGPLSGFYDIEALIIGSRSGSPVHATFDKYETVPPKITINFKTGPENSQGECRFFVDNMLKSGEIVSITYEFSNGSRTVTATFP